jgi:hypothetical protein
MLKPLRTKWGQWREWQRQKAIDRATDKARIQEKPLDPYSKGGGGDTGVNDGGGAGGFG